ncbi:MAG: aminoglycoside phosphotransferase family protein [Proteobacteria bacterium]|nr:aminoglycoside phosphotransferase family protein [Pseudomonadota bacterium]
MTLSVAPQPDAAIVASLRHAGLVDGTAEYERLTGGISSNIWKVTTPERSFCVKRALPQLAVEVEWRVPVERNRFEVDWYKIAENLVPGGAPKILAHDEDAMLFAMEFLDPGAFKLYKNELRDGRADPAVAAETGRRLACIHAGTAGRAELRETFPRNDIFHAIRLEPYLEATAGKHPDLHDVLFALSERTHMTRLAMIHGDVSPKNILIGPDGPVFLDAECACIGDPAFDLAFCLNHFLLKCLWTPAAKPAFLDCFDAMTAAYLAGVDWEAPDEMEARTASLLPGLFLARVDGKSPVEYVTDETDKDKVRRVGRALLRSPPSRLADIRVAWEKELAA